MLDDLDSCAFISFVSFLAYWHYASSHSKALLLEPFGLEIWVENSFRTQASNIGWHDDMLRCNKEKSINSIISQKTSVSFHMTAVKSSHISHIIVSSSQ